MLTLTQRINRWKHWLNRNKQLWQVNTYAYNWGKNII